MINLGKLRIDTCSYCNLFRRIIIVIAVSVSFVLCTNAYDFKKNGLYYNILSDNTVECCGGGQSPSDATYRQAEVIIPSNVQYELKNYTVVKIADYAWANVQYLVCIKKLVLPETITEIGDAAFLDANSIESINLPEGLKRIGNSAMRGPRITEYIFPKTLESIGSRAFNSKLKSVVFTSSIAPSIMDETFKYQNGGMDDVFIPSGFQIFVPNMDAYANLPSAYSNYLVPICTFESCTFEYSGKVPDLKYSIALPSDHSLSFNLENLPINAGRYDLVLSGKIDQSISIGIPVDIEITKAPLQIKAKNMGRQYGDENPLLSAEIFGIQNGEDINNIITNGYRLYTTANQKSDVGDYPILLSSSASINYTVEFIQGCLSVTKAPLSIRVSDYRREYGKDNPDFDIIYGGLKNNESYPKWDKKPIISVDATKYSNVGSYPISVDCSPHNYEIASSENGMLTITAAPLTIKVSDCKREYYDNNPPFSFTLYGLRNNDTDDCLSKKPSFDCLAKTDSDCGTYAITPSSAESQNYDISYESGILTIEKAPLVVKAKDTSREYGDENQILKFQAIGLKGNDTEETAFQQYPELATTAMKDSAVGDYPISIAGGSSKNYQLSYRQGVLSVTKAPLSVCVEDVERVYGSNNPVFVRSYLGFKLSDTEKSAFSVLPKISTSASKTSDVGEYPIIVSGGTARNYEIVSYENGTLMITKAKASITANNKQRLYCQENPQFDFSVSGLLNGDTQSCVTTPPMYNCDADILSDAGVYKIVPSDAVAKNYVFEYVSGNLTINKRSLTASVGNYSRTYGEDNPVFEINYSGFVNNEDASVLVNPATVSCSANSYSDVGAYPINISGGNAKNYQISKYNPGVLTITKADQVITWNQDLSNVDLYSQVELMATSDVNLPITYEMSPNNVATLYSNAGKWYLDCYNSGSVNIRATQNGNKNYKAAITVTKTLVVYGGGEDPSNTQIFINVEEPGSLPNLIAENRKYQIKNLRLAGYLNGTDINYIREMCGSDSNGNSTVGALEILDISGCMIVSGGRSYYQSNFTSDNIIGSYMFYNCKVLTTLRLPDSITSIGDFSFADCERLSVISVPNSVEYYGKQSFRNDISLLRVPMPNDLKTIDDMAFSGCNGLSEITIPSNVTYIGSGITINCQNLERINVDADNTNYTSRDGVLYNSSIDELIIYPIGLEGSEFVVPEGVKQIAAYAFMNAKELKIVHLPSSLIHIGQDSFVGCVNLTALRIKALTPPTCQNDCFDDISKTRCELYVPIGCRSYYWVAPVWSEFNKITEIDFGGIKNVYYDNVQVKIENGTISISGCPSDTVIRIYNTKGNILYQAYACNNVVEFNPYTRGVYFVVLGSKIYKIKL